MTGLNKSDHPVKWIHISKLSVVWVKAQRPFSEVRAKKIAQEFDPDAFGVLTVTLPNGIGVYHIIDGQHRKSALAEWGGENQQAPCEVLPIDDPARAAEIWKKRNENRRPSTTVENFLLAVTAGYDNETKIHQLLTEMNYIVSSFPANGHIKAVAACKSIYQKHGIEVLRDALIVCEACWGRSNHSVSAFNINGIGEFLGRHRGYVEMDRLIKPLRAFGETRFWGETKTYKEVRKIATLTEATVGFLLDQYNHRNKKPLAVR